MLQALNIPADLKITPAYVHTFETNPSLPTIIYYTRRYTLHTTAAACHTTTTSARMVLHNMRALVQIVRMSPCVRNVQQRDTAVAYACHPCGVCLLSYTVHCSLY
jgi:hypothetical protein